MPQNAAVLIVLGRRDADTVVGASVATAIETVVAWPVIGTLAEGLEQVTWPAKLFPSPPETVTIVPHAKD